MFPLFPTWANCRHAWGAGRIGESKSAAYLFLGPSCNRGLGHARSGRIWRRMSTA